MHGDAMHELQAHKLPHDAVQDWSQFGTPLRPLLLKHYLGALAGAPASVSRLALRLPL